MKSTNDLTRGPVTATLLRFSAPLLLGNLLQTLYGIVDLMVVGQFTDSAALAAVSAGALIMNSFGFMIISFTAGGTVLIGQLLGMRREDEVRETVATCFTLYPLTGLLFTGLLLLLARPLLTLMNTPAESFAGALQYMYVCIGGMFFSAGYSALASVLRGLGDSRRPLLFVAIACVANVLGDLLLVAVFDMGPVGAAIATTGAQALSMVLGIIYLRNRDFIFDFKPRSFALRRHVVRSLFKLGVPMAMQEFMVTASFIFLEALINGLGFVAVAAAGVTDKLFMVAVIPSTAFSTSISAMVAQNIGAGLPERAKKSLRAGLVMSFSVAALIFLLMLLSPETPLRLFTKDPAVLAEGCRYAFFYKYEYLACGLSFSINGFVNGTGHTKFTMWSSLLSSFIIRVPLVWHLSALAGASLYQIGAALPIASFAQLLVVAAYYFSGRWRKRLVLSGAPT